jgi:AraC-like DNA-binding protein
MPDMAPLMRVKADEMPDRRFFSTDSLPERDRFPAFCEEFVRRHTPLDIAPRDGGAPFRAVIEMQRAGPVEVSTHFNTSTDFLRSPHLLRDGYDGLAIALIRSGCAYQTQSGTDVKLEPGEAIVCDNAYSGGFHLPTDVQWSSVLIPRAAIRKSLPRNDRLAGAKLGRDDVALRLLFGYLAGTLDVDLDGERASELCGEHIIDLVALALGTEDDAREAMEQHSIGAMRRAAILREIETRATDPRLSADVIASGLGITPRYVRLLLEKTGRSFSQHVLEKRLDRAADLLRDPRREDSKVSVIAFACGFSDLSYFNRAFRRRYGETPTDARQSARRQNRDDRARI